MAENRPTRKAAAEGPTYTANLEGFKTSEDRPKFSVSAIGRNGAVLHRSVVDASGKFTLPDKALKDATRIVIGPDAEEGEEVDPETLLRYRPSQFADLLKDRVINIPRPIWESWIRFIRCVTGKVRVCRRRPWWFDELYTLASTPTFTRLEERTIRPLTAASLASQAEFSVAIDFSRFGRLKASHSIPELIAWPVRCQVVCNGVVEVYRRTCCCLPWIIDDPRLPDLLDELEGILHRIQVVPKIPFPPNPPEPRPILHDVIFKDGTLDEMALNAQQDLLALRRLPIEQIPAYVNARPYLLCRHYSCSTPVKVGQGVIHPDGRFTICWLDFRRPLSPRCHDEYAYVVKQTLGPFTFTIYNGLAANVWFEQGDDAELVSYHPFAFGCRDNGEPGTGAFVYLDLIGDTRAHNLKTPASTGWDRVAAPAYNDGLAFPAPSPAAAVGANLDRNWGGTLKLNYMFSEDLKGVGGKYYRISITEADSTGAPVGTRNYVGDGLSWEKAVPTGTGSDIVPVNLGPFSAGGQDFLYLIPYDSDGDWSDDQYHAFLDTTDSRWSDPDKRHLITLEIFDAAGKRLRPTGTPATGQPGAEGTAGFTYRRRFQEFGATSNVPFGALTHMFWWDNRLPVAAIVFLTRDGLEFDEECLFLGGTASSTFGIGYRAYHLNPIFQLSHGISWQRGLGTAAGATGTLLASSSANVGVPPALPGTSPTNTFAQMLRTDLDPTRLKCAFTVFLSIYAKTTDGESLGNGYYDTKSAAFAIEINA